jgi:hypothetical protein
MGFVAGWKAVAVPNSWLWLAFAFYYILSERQKQVRLTKADDSTSIEL